ncbi:hypothetical protein G6F35_017793 [Rhizopus arrhizus]|nr:hypothetical protein G6F35_017793 [Rhizopus arrhizus]
MAAQRRVQRAAGIRAFVARVARQQGGNRGHGCHAVEQHGADGFSDGQFDIDGAGAVQRGARAAHAFGRDAAGQDVCQLAAGADFQADAAVARQFARGGQHQIAQAGQAGKGRG